MGSGASLLEPSAEKVKELDEYLCVANEENVRKFVALLSQEAQTKLQAVIPNGSAAGEAPEAHDDPNKIQVAMISGDIDSFSLPEGRESTVALLKDAIHRTGAGKLPAAQLTLLAGEEVMKNDRKLSSYDVTLAITLLKQPDVQTKEGRRLLASTDPSEALKALEKAMGDHKRQCKMCDSVYKGILHWEDRDPCTCTYTPYNNDEICRACERGGVDREVTRQQCQIGADLNDEASNMAAIKRK